MKLFVRKVILLLVLLSAVTLSHRIGTAHVYHHSNPQSQTESVKKANAGTISGKVTIKGKGAQGVPIILRADEYIDRLNGPLQTVTSDQDGNYQIRSVVPGAYRVVPMAPTFVVEGETSLPFRNAMKPNGKAVLVGERETVSNVDFALTPGGVITGRITDSEGRPLIEQQVFITPVSKSSRQPRSMQRYSSTDDRGIYRSFGLPSGSFLVSVGPVQNAIFGRGVSTRYRQTFYPSVNEASKATIIEVSEGSEVANVDITMAFESASDTFAISGRVVDGSGHPVPNVMLGLQMSMDSGSSSMSSSAWTSDQAGGFKFNNLNPGKYAVYMVGQASSELRADRVPVEIINQDVTGVIIKAVGGSSISGDVVFENGNLKSDSSRFNELPLQVFVHTQNPDEGDARLVSVNPDGSFRVGGLRAGTAYFRAGPVRSQTMGYRIIQVERDGVLQARGVEVKEGESISRVRLTVRSGKGMIRGIVKAENGDLPAPPRLMVSFSVAGEDPTTSPMGSAVSSQVKIDSRGHFLIENLPAGDYEINATVYGPRNMVSTKQQVSVADGSVSEVTLTLNLKPN